MRTSKRLEGCRVLGAAAVLLALACAPGLATTYTWSGAVDTDWGTSGNWTLTTGPASPSGFPNAPADVANATVGTGTSIAISSAYTVGALNANKTLGGAGTLVFDNGGSGASFSFTGGNPSIQVTGIRLDDDLRLTAQVGGGGRSYFDSVLSGAHAVTFIHSGGNFHWRADNSGFAAGVNLEGGKLDAWSNTCLGTGTLNLGAVTGSTAVTYNQNAGTPATGNSFTGPVNLNQTFSFDSNTGSRYSGLNFDGPVTLVNGDRTVNIVKDSRPPSIYGSDNPNNHYLTINGAIGDGGNGYGLIKTGIGYLWLNGANTYTGDTTVSSGKLMLGSAGSLLMDINDADSTQLLGTGTLNLDGALNLDVADVTALGNWLLVDVVNLDETYDTGFSVAMYGGASFTESSDVWTYSDAGGDWTFTEGTGALEFVQAPSSEVIPEPATAALLGLTACGLGGSTSAGADGPEAWHWDSLHVLPQWDERTGCRCSVAIILVEIPALPSRRGGLCGRNGLTVEHRQQQRSDCSSACECAGGIDRRGVLKLAGAGSAALLASGIPAMAGPFSPADFHELIPPDKKLDPAWVESLFARGEPTVYGGPGRRAELEKIGMPIGGICAGQLYLGGDGKLWHWDILNRHAKTSEGAYVHPPKPASPLDQGFAIRVRTNGKSVVKALDHTGFETITFRGEYPIGRVEYRDRTLPVSVSLEAFSPFIPLNADDSGLPATIMRFTLKNTGKEAVEADIAGWLENAVCLYSKPSCTLANTITRRSGTTCLECRALPPEKADQPDIVFDDFEDGTFGRWTVAGNAFGKTPISTADSGRYVAPAKAGGKFFAFSMHEVPDNSAMGTLTSKTFTIERDYIVFQICGGNHKEKTCVNLLVDGKVVDSIVGPNGPRMSVRKFDVKALRGETAQLQIVDAADRPTNWRGGYIGVDAITFTNTPLNSVGRYCEEFDYGTLTLAVLEGAGEELAIASLPAGKLPDVLFADQGLAQGGAARRQIREEKPRGAVGRAMRLAPGAEQTVSFVIAWNFPNLVIEDGGPGHGGIHLEDEGNHYATRFRNATATVEYLVANLGRLTDQTRLWHDTWYDSTLPYWFLDRTFANTSTLASSTCIRFAGGRFWGWEGVDCCPGTCTHVWHYAQAVGRVFPELERIVRERVDFGLAFDEKTGKIMYRGEKERESNLYGLSRDGSAVDGQAGTILRVYREHQMSADNAFLRRIWPKVKRGLDWLIAKDADGDGLIEASQHNTLDRDLHGPSSWLSSLYVAALRAGEAMARELGDVAFAEKVAPVAASGSRKIAGELFNGEYFIHKPAREGGVGYGPGCEIDQVFGQGWAHQVNLGRILPKDKTLSALRSLWKYNFAFDVGPYFKKHAGGRVFARPGEAGLIMCTWPQGGRPSGRAYGGDLYSECMHGFEYQAAGHMIFEGLVKEGLAVTRSVHDRYHPVKRNPWNEIECGEHYARSMASYGIFLAACGFEYHGPGGHIGFAPALTPENFKAAFIGAEGWGTFAQKDKVGRRNVALAVKWGKLRLRTLSLGATSGTVPRSADASLNGKAVDCTLGVKHGKATLTFDVNTILKAGQTLDVLLK